jgi:peptidoglycan hydrolase CwlO-like protein
MSESEVRSLLCKMISDLKEDSNKEINEVRKSIQNLDKKVSNIEKKFNKEMEIIKSNQVEMSKMKTSLNQIKTTVDILSVDKIKQKKEYQRWKLRLRNYCMQTITN